MSDNRVIEHETAAPVVKSDERQSAGGNNTEEDMQVAIIAGGLGTRLGPLTRDKPKSMVEILGKPFLEYQLEFLRKGGIRDVVLCLGHLGKLIEEYFGNGSGYGISIRYSYEDLPLGTAGALRHASSLLKDVFWTIYGDSYLFLDYGEIHRYFRSQNKLALMTVYKNFNRFERSNTAIDNHLV